MIHAWGWTPSGVSDRDKIPGIGLIQYQPNYPVARRGDIAYATTVRAAREALKYQDKWKLAILGDEQNYRQTPDEYNRQMEPVDAIFREAGIPTCASAIGLKEGAFDHEWLQGVTVGDYRAANMGCAGFERTVKGMEQYPEYKWVATLIPVRPNWFPLRYNTILAYIWQSIRYNWLTQLRSLQDHPQVVATALWCLKEGKLSDGEWQGWHGLVDRHGNLTKQGRVVREVTET